VFLVFITLKHEGQSDKNRGFGARGSIDGLSNSLVRKCTERVMSYRIYLCQLY